jgi:hypothetical protein
VPKSGRCRSVSNEALREAMAAPRSADGATAKKPAGFAPLETLTGNKRLKPTA